MQGPLFQAYQWSEHSLRLREQFRSECQFLKLGILVLNFEFLLLLEPIKSVFVEFVLKLFVELPC